MWFRATYERLGTIFFTAVWSLLVLALIDAVSGEAVAVLVMTLVCLGLGIASFFDNPPRVEMGRGFLLAGAETLAFVVLLDMRGEMPLLLAGLLLLVVTFWLCFFSTWAMTEREAPQGSRIGEVVVFTLAFYFFAIVLFGLDLYAKSLARSKQITIDFN